MNSRQWRKLAHAARKFGIQVTKPTGTESQPHTGHTKSTNQGTGKRPLLQFLSPIWKWLVGVATVLGTVATINSLRYDVSIDSYATLNPKEPLETRFVLTNQGPYSIHRLTYSCAFPDVKVSGVPPDVNVVGFDGVAFEQRELEARGKVSLRCQSPFPVTDHSVLQISVSYRPSFWPWRIDGASAFMFKQGPDGNGIWLPMGRITRYEDIPKR